MGDRGTRTFICTVVFIDIVEYSKKSVAEQMRVKQQLTDLLARALADVPGKDRIILDTGDGAAVNFLGDPEEGLFLGLALRDALAAAEDDALRLRTGINLGPVRLIKDINNQPNIIGDGINVAQRVMGFAEVNQVLASRSYYEVISTLSADYAQLFSFQGARTDKHVREHEVYALGNAPAPQRAPRQKAAPAAAFEKLGHTASTARIGVMRRPKLATALAVALILGSAVALRVNLRNGTIPPPPPEEPVAATTLPEPVATPAAPAPAVQPETKAPPAAPVAKAEPPPRTGLFRKTPAQTPTPAPPQPVEVATGTVRLIVLPWGEIHIDGQRYGVAPPLRDIALKPGPHRIEIRNPGFASYVQVVEVESGKEIRIRHRFR
ncbi:MAG: PEGA domain-containing protein [Burkholderiales bacterium]